jgi:hypothetical protein
VRVRTLVEDRHRLSCRGAAGASAGNESCTPGSDPAGTLYVGPSLPDNPTGVRDLGVKSERIHCADIPSNPLVTCSPDPTPGGTR